MLNMLPNTPSTPAPHLPPPAHPDPLPPPQGTGEDEDDVESSSGTLVQSDEGYAPVFFTPRGLKNLVLVDEMPSLMPLTDMKVANLLDEEIPQIYATTGRCVRGVCGEGVRGRCSFGRVVGTAAAAAEQQEW
jgi:hypothetical protein